jgi:membrane-associated protease RseP (regulator of RpoE activity)
VIFLGLDFFLYLAIFWIILYAVGRVFKLKKIKISPFYLQVDLPVNFINKSDKNKFSWMRKVSAASIWISLIMGSITLVYLFISFFKTLLQSNQASISVIPVIPGITVNLTPAVIISIFLLAIVHELAHGYSSVVEGIPVRRLGFFILFVIPGAFTEPDDTEMKRAEPKKRAGIEAAGSTSNLALGLLLLAIAVFIFQGFPASPHGILVSDVMKDGPSYGKLRPGDVIVGINGMRIKSMDQLQKLKGEMKPGQTVIIQTLDRNVSIVLGASNNSTQPLIGIFLSPLPYYRTFLPINIAMPLEEFLFWAIILNLGVAMFNSLPLAPLDGGLIVRDLLEIVYGKERAEFLIKAISLLTAVVLLFDMASSLIMYMK